MLRGVSQALITSLITCHHCVSFTVALVICKLPRIYVTSCAASVYFDDANNATCKAANRGLACHIPCCRSQSGLFSSSAVNVREAHKYIIHACNTTMQYAFVLHCFDVMVLCTESQISNKRNLSWEGFVQKVGFELCAATLICINHVGHGEQDYFSIFRACYDMFQHLSCSDRLILTCAPLYIGGAGIVITHVCVCVRLSRKITDERGDRCRPNWQTRARGNPLEVINF